MAALLGWFLTGILFHKKSVIDCDYIALAQRRTISRSSINRSFDCNVTNNFFQSEANNKTHGQARSFSLPAAGPQSMWSLPFTSPGKSSARYLEYFSTKSHALEFAIACLNLNKHITSSYVNQWHTFLVHWNNQTFYTYFNSNIVLTLVS